MGTLVAVVQDELPGVYSRLRDQVSRAGLLDYRPYRYGLKIGVTIAAFAAGWATFVVVGNTWLSAGVAVLLAVLFTQVVFLGHDAGHQEIVRSARVNRLIGLTVGNAVDRPEHRMVGAEAQRGITPTPTRWGGTRTSGRV